MKRGRHRLSVVGMVGLRFVRQLINDCLGRTETAMTQAHVFKAAVSYLRAQAAATRIA
jgi:hypothetical protein